MPALYCETQYVDVRTPRTQSSAPPVKPDPDRWGNSWDWTVTADAAIWLGWLTLLAVLAG